MKKVTPMDIFNKDFKYSFRGYDTDEVNEFLDLIIQNYESVLKENETLKEALTKGKGSTENEDDSNIIQNILTRVERLEKKLSLSSTY